MDGRLLLSVSMLLAVNAACKKTVISDKVVPVATPVATLEPPKKGIGDGVPDTKAILRLTQAKCDAERKTAFAVKVAGLKNADWIPLTCNDKSREVEINTKKGYCNVLQLKADVSFVKTGLPEERYTRQTVNASDKVFFNVDQRPSESGGVQGMNIHFEDTNDSYWNTAYMFCMKNPAGVVAVEPITGVKNQSCSNILKGYTGQDGRPVSPAVDWNDFEFTVESDQVQFTVEGFPEIGCSPN